MPQLGTMSLEIEGLLLLLLLLLAPTIHATATHLANKSCRRERGKKKVETNAWAPKLKAFMPQMTEFAPRGQHFSHITAAWRAEFSCFSPIKKKKKTSSSTGSPLCHVCPGWGEAFRRPLCHHKSSVHNWTLWYTHIHTSSRARWANLFKFMLQ